MAGRETIGMRAADFAPALASADGGLTVEGLTPGLLVGALTVLAAVAAVRLTSRTGLPSLVLYLGIGMLLSAAGLGILLEDVRAVEALASTALAFILIEGGLTTRWSNIRQVVAPAVALATVGVVISALVLAFCAHHLLGMEWPVALVIGAVLASTDAGAVFSVLRGVPLPKRLSGLIEAESGFNDPPAIILVIALAGAAVDPSASTLSFGLVLSAGWQLVGGILVGLVVGWVGVRVLRLVASTSSGLFALAVFAVATFGYAGANTVGVSGFIACYVAAFVMGNSNLPHQQAVNGFGTALGWLAQIGLFVMLGMLATPSHLLDQAVPALIVGAALLFIARPISVGITLLPFRLPWREQVFISWAGLRGAVPVVLATVPMAMGLDAEWVFDLVFVLVAMFVLIQAPLMLPMARALKVTAAYQSTPLAVELVPLEELDAAVLLVSVGRGSRLAGVQTAELRLPRGANVTLIVRDGEGFVPTPTTVIRTGDELLVVTTARAGAAAERRIQAVSEEGRLAGWHGGRRQTDPPPPSSSR